MTSSLPPTLALLLWLLAAPVMGAETGTGYRALEQAVAAEPQPTVALDLARHFIADNPDHEPARLLAARLALLSDQPIAALGLLAPLLTASQQDWQPWFWAGTAYLAQGEVQLARTQLNRALQRGSDRAVVWNQIAVLEQEIGNHGGALTHLEIALEIDPAFATGYLNRAYSLEHLGRFDQALAAYRTYLTQPTQGPRSEHARVINRIQELSARLATLAARAEAGARVEETVKPGGTRSRGASASAADSAGDS
ncbi:MAG: tetratricopeptide repeat protein [Pseudomonadota bacterium]